MPNPLQRHKAACTGFIAATMLLLLALPGQTLADSRDSRDARRELNLIRMEIERELRARPEMKQAKQEWIDRRGEYYELRRAVVATLLTDSRYLSLRAEMWGLQDELDALRKQSRNGAAGAARTEEVHRLSLDIMDLGSYLSVLERRTLEQHHAALQAKEAYLAAGRKLLELHRSISEAVRQDPRFRRARSAVVGTVAGTHRVP